MGTDPWVIVGQTCPCPKPQLCSPDALLVVDFMRTSFFFPPSITSPLLGQTTPDASSCWPLEEQPQPAHSPGPGGDPFSYFSFSRVLLDRQSNKIFHFASLPKTSAFLHITRSPICLFSGSPACRLFGSAHHHPATLPSPCPWRGEAGASFLDFPGPASLPKPCQRPARPSSAKQRYRPGAPLSPSPVPHATARPHPNSSHPRIAGSPFSPYYNHHHQQSQRCRTPAIHS